MFTEVLRTMIHQEINPIENFFLQEDKTEVKTEMSEFDHEKHDDVKWV